MIVLNFNEIPPEEALRFIHKLIAIDNNLIRFDLIVELERKRNAPLSRWWGICCAWIFHKLVRLFDGNSTCREVRKSFQVY
jgi:hypothetical protein